MLISYAQNFEDVILWRALKHIERGYYVDIGAQDPVKDSVSLAFYTAGWRGLHVEPSPYYATRIRAARPDEDVIEAAVSQTHGIITFYESVATGLSTCDPALAERHTADGYEFRQIRVPTIPLADILEGCAGREIHWLKIDVEGFEPAVIAGWAPSSARPWVVIVESILPGSHEPTFAGWEPTLLELGYDFAYFDGLNRFYLSRQHPELAPAFGPGPNILDAFALSGENSNTFADLLDKKTVLLDQRLAEQRETAHALTHRIEEFELEVRGINQQLAAAEHASEELRLELDALKPQLTSAERARVEAYRQLDLEKRTAQQRAAETGRTHAAARRQLEARIAELESAVNHWQVSATHTQLEVAALRHSISWRITAPVRWVHSKTVALHPGARSLLAITLSRVARQRRLRICARLLTKPVPGLRRRLQALLARHADAANRAPDGFFPGDPAAATLPRSARLVYEQLKAARG